MKVLCPKCNAGYLATRHTACPWCDRREADRSRREGWRRDGGKVERPYDGKDLGGKGGGLWGR